MAIQAWATALRLADSPPRWKLHVVGVPQGASDELIKAAAELGVAGSVQVHGYLPDADTSVCSHRPRLF